MIKLFMFSKRTTKNALGTMFGIELAFVNKTLQAWFNKKVSSPFKRLEQAVIQKYEKKKYVLLESRTKVRNL